MKVRVFFSGLSNVQLPEIVLADKPNVNVLLTYSEIYEGKRDTYRRLKRHYFKTVHGIIYLDHLDEPKKEDKKDVGKKGELSEGARIGGVGYKKADEGDIGTDELLCVPEQ